MADLSLDLRPQLVGTPQYGDLVMRNGDFVLTSPTDGDGTDQTVQFIANRLRLFLGEYFMDTSAGLPYISLASAKGTTQADIDAVVRDAILGTPGVVALTQYQGTAKRAQRLYEITFKVVTQTSGSVTSTVAVGA